MLISSLNMVNPLEIHASAANLDLFPCMDNAKNNTTMIGDKNRSCIKPNTYTTLNADEGHV